MMDTLRDGGHVEPACSDCRAVLMDAWVVRPDEDSHWKIRALCPWCGGSSFVHEIAGGFCPAGASRPKEDDDEEVVPSTAVDGYDIAGDTFVFRILKAAPDATPIRRD